MLTVLFLVLLATATLLVPALSLQFALGYWFRPAERLPLEEAWARRFEDAFAVVEAVHQSDGALRE